MLDRRGVLAYSVASPCELRNRLGETGVLALAVRPPPSEPGAAARFTAARGATNVLCAHCQANVHARELGCAGIVPTPLPPLAEAWLLSRLPRSPDCTAGAILLSAIADHEWDGRYAARLRANPGLTFEASQSLVQGDDTPGGLRVSSDQAFDMLFGAAHVRRAHPLLVALAFGVIPHDTPPDELGELRQEPERVWSYLAAARLPTASRDGVRGSLGDALTAAATAAALGVEMLVESN